MGSNSSPIVSLVIPFYNVGPRLKFWVNSILVECRSLPSVEIILVNDGSPDNLDDLNGLTKPGNVRLHIIGYPKNFGKGYAVAQGVKASDGEFIFFTDIDWPYGVVPILKSLELFKNQKVDAVVGSRDHSESIVVSPPPLYRGVLKVVFGKLVKKIFGLPLEDTQCGFKGFRQGTAKEIFGQLTAQGFCFDIELLLLLKKYGKVQHEVPVVFTHRNQSSISLLRHTPRVFYELTRLLIRFLAGYYRYKN